MKVKLQLALDTLDADHALKLARQTAAYIDIFEAGTPLIKSAGIGIISKLRSLYPDKIILADLKTNDGGAYEANSAFRAGADIVTTQGITSLETIKEVQREAKKWSRRVVVHMNGVADPVARVREIIPVGVHMVLYQRSIDEEKLQGALWDDDARQTVGELCDLGIDVALAGGINLDMLPLLPKAPIYGIVVGRGITDQPDPAAAARAISDCARDIWRK